MSEDSLRIVLALPVFEDTGLRRSRGRLDDKYAFPFPDRLAFLLLHKSRLMPTIGKAPRFQVG